MKTVLTISIVLAAFAASAAASAAPYEHVAVAAASTGQSQDVQYSREQLGSDRGVRAVYRDITRAAGSVCSNLPLQYEGVESPFIFYSGPYGAYRDCIARTVAATVAAMGSERLTAFWAKRTSPDPVRLSAK